MNVWVVILAAGAVSYLLRLSMIVLADRVQLPARLDEASVLVAPAALAALAATGITGAAVAVGGVGALAPLAAVSVAALAVARTGLPLAAIAAGMPTLWLVTALLPG